MELHSQAILTALVAAAKADGHIDARERDVIEGEFARLGTDGDVQQWLHAELEKPPDTHALGVPMRDIQALGKRIGRQPALMQPLWDSGIYEARLLVAFIADPAQVTSAQMDRWCRQFDNWAVCDTLCLHLFDRSPHAWGRIDAWARKRGEFEKRAAFALLAGVDLRASVRRRLQTSMPSSRGSIRSSTSTS